MPEYEAFRINCVNYVEQNVKDFIFLGLLKTF